MKRLPAIAAFALSFCLFASASASETWKVTVKKVDASAKTITFRQDGASQDQVLPVEASVELEKVKANAKAQLTVEDGVVKQVQAEGRRRAPGY